MLKNILWLSRYKHPLLVDHRTFLVDLNEDDNNPLDLGAFYSRSPIDDEKFTVESEHYGLPYSDDIRRPNGRLVKRIIASDRPFIVTFWDSFDDFGLALEWDGKTWTKHEHDVENFDELDTIPYFDGLNISSSFANKVLNLPFNFPLKDGFNIELCHRDNISNLSNVESSTALVKYYNEEHYTTMTGDHDFTNVDSVIDASVDVYDRLTIIFDDENTSEKMIKNVFDLDNKQVHTVLSLSNTHDDLVNSAKVIFQDKPDVVICIVVNMEDPNDQYLFINGEHVSKEVNYLI